MPAPTQSALPHGYADWLNQLKQDITHARQRAALAVNAELVQLYARIGREIMARQQAQGWGAKVIERLAHDLKAAFPDMRGWSSRNLKYMAFFAQHCPNGLFGQQPAAQMPWFHIVTLLTKLENDTAREWYALQAVQQGWSRTTLELSIKNRLYQRRGAAICKQQNRLVAEYALSGIEKPIGVAEYQLIRNLPESLGHSLPSIEAIEAELAAEVENIDAIEKPGAGDASSTPAS